MARLQLGTVLVMPDPIALSIVLDQALDGLPAEQRSRVTCERLDAPILAEAKYLQRAFVYLFKHILQHTPASSVITLHIRITDQQRVVISIDGVVLPSDPVLLALQTIVGLREGPRGPIENSGNVQLIARPGAVSLDRVAQQYARATAGLAEGVGIPAGETPPGTAADPAGAFSCFVVNAVHGI